MIVLRVNDTSLEEPYVIGAILQPENKLLHEVEKEVRDLWIDWREQVWDRRTIADSDSDFLRVLQACGYTIVDPPNEITLEAP